jgi:sialic acid synthase SpsE/sugar phosphate isomerase/epimerase
MIIDRNLQQYIIHEDTTIAEAMEKISVTKGRVLFGVNSDGHLSGVLTNGDLIRWFVKCRDAIVNLQIPVNEILNTQYSYSRTTDAPEKTLALLDDYLYIPLIDAQGRLVAVARKRDVKDNNFCIGSRHISDETPVYIIAEIGNNHNGSLDRAKRLIDAAVRAGADCAKFQMRDMDSLYQKQGNNDGAKENLGAQYTLDLLSRFQLTNDELFAAFDHCKANDITPLCTPWDKKTVLLLEEYGMPAYKVASADLTNHDLIKVLIETGKPFILSTGMSREDEIKETVELCRRHGANYALLHCISTYPPPFRDINLKYLSRLKEIGQTVIGYSGHERDIFVGVAAVACGARIIEKHFTEDRSLEGSDHKISLLPDEFSRLVEGISQIDEAMGRAIKGRDLSQGEMMNRAILAKSVYIKQDLSEGSIIERYMLETKSPGNGLQPNRKEELIGQTIQREMKAGDVFHLSDLELGNKVPPRNYDFKQPWGIPVRFHDYQTLIKKTNATLLEFHLSYKDIELPINQFFKEHLKLDLVVHSPELFAGDHTLDLCSPDQLYRERSIFELQRVINKTRELSAYFNKVQRIGIVTNVGGFTESAPLHGIEKKIRMEILANSLHELNLDGVEIWPQTMPPYPWHFGGQRYHNLLVDADEIVEFSESQGYRICLDISHSKLACNHHNESFTSFIQKVGPYTAHLHIADAKGLDGEGLQIGEGDIDFVSLANVLEEYAPGVSMIPEIWQGHENDGEEFWIALDKLEGFLGK